MVMGGADVALSTATQAAMLLTPALLALASGMLFHTLLLHPQEPVPWWPWRGFLLVSSEDRLRSWLRLRLGRQGAQSWFESLQPEWMAAYLTARAQERLSWILEQVLAHEDLVLWENLPLWARQRVMQQIRHDLPAMMDGIIEDLTQLMDKHADWVTQAAADLRQSARDAVLYRRLLPWPFSYNLIWAGLGALLGILAWTLRTPQVAAGVCAASLILPWWASQFLWRRLPLDAQLDDAVDAALIENLRARRLLACLWASDGAELADAVVTRHLDALLQHRLTTRTFVRFLGDSGLQRLRQRAQHLARPMLMSCLAESGVARHEQALLAARLQAGRPTARTWRQLQAEMLGRSHVWLMLGPALLLAWLVNILLHART